MNTPNRDREESKALELMGLVETHPSVQEWLRDIYRQGPQRKKRRGRAVMVAAGIFLACGIAAHFYFAAPHYETHVGEQRDIMLPDGSRVTLNTNTALTVRYSKARRYIQLERGEAWFSVVHNSERPFDVSAEGITTRAIGTQFNVDLRRAEVTVSVLEGVVQVAATHSDPIGTDDHSKLTSDATQQGTSPVVLALAKNEGVEIWLKDRRAVTQKADLRRINAWRMRRLDFTDTPLSDAIQEFNRYSNTHVVIGTPELGSVHVSGVFQIGDVDAFLFSLKEALHVQALESQGQVILMRVG